MVTEDIKVTQDTVYIKAIRAMVDILVILVTAIQVIPFIMAILVTMVTPATMGTWDTRAILDTEVWGIQDTTIWDIMDTMGIMNMEIWAIIRVGNGDNLKKKRVKQHVNLLFAGFMFYQLL